HIEIAHLYLHDALPISEVEQHLVDVDADAAGIGGAFGLAVDADEVVGDRIEDVVAGRAFALGTVVAGRSVELRQERRARLHRALDRKSTRLNSSHVKIS